MLLMFFDEIHVYNNERVHISSMLFIPGGGRIANITDIRKRVALIVSFVPPHPAVGGRWTYRTYAPGRHASRSWDL